jgi:hypothetical protein
MSGQLKITGQPIGSTIIPEDEIPDAFAPLTTPGPGLRMFVIGSHGLGYWLERHGDADAVVLTLSEIETVGDDLRLGKVVSRKRITTEDAVHGALEVMGHGTEAEIHDRTTAIRKEMAAAKLFEMLALVGVELGSETITIPVETNSPTTSLPDALDRAWPDDDWSGTAEQVREMVGKENSLANVKKALQRGPYESTQTPGKASIWRRVVRPRR